MITRQRSEPVEASVARRVTAVAASLVALAAIAGLWSRYTYKQWPWSDYPNPLHYCNADFVPSGTQSRQQITSSGQYLDFHRSGDLPGVLNRGQIWIARERGASAAGGCRADRVWVRIGTNSYEQMDQEGGY